MKAFYFSSLFFFLYISSTGQMNIDANDQYPVKNDDRSNHRMNLNNHVDKKTGKFIHQFPIFDLSSKELTFQVSALYQGGGIKVDEVASQLGLGWDLEIPNYIRRNIVGLPDETLLNVGDILVGSIYNLADPTLNANYNDNLDEYNDIDPNSDNSLFAKAGKGKLELQPDEFYYSIPGHSGMFVIDYRIFVDLNTTKTINGVDYIKFPVVTAPYDNIEVWGEFNAGCGTSTEFKSFWIFDESGNSYLLDEREYTGVINSTWPHLYEAQFSKLLKYTSGFYLTKVLNSNGETEFQIEYNHRGDPEHEYEPIIWVNSDQIYIPVFSSSNSGIKRQSKNQFCQFDFSGYCQQLGNTISNVIIEDNSVSWKSIIEIQNIISPLGKIEFSYGPNRLDSPNEKELLQITKKLDNGEIISKINFIHRYTGSSSADYRLILDRTENVNANGEIVLGEKYKYFENVLLPSYQSFSFDHLGYFNGSGNLTSIPYQSDLVGLMNFSFANKEPSLNHTMAQSLTEIQSTFGSTLKIQYELNSYSSINGTIQSSYGIIGGLRVHQLEQLPDNEQNAQVLSFIYGGLSNEQDGWGDILLSPNYRRLGFLRFWPSCTTFGSELSCNDHCSDITCQRVSGKPENSSIIGSNSYFYYPFITEINADGGFTTFQNTRQTAAINEFEFPFAPVTTSKFKAELIKKSLKSSDGQKRKEFNYSYSDVNPNPKSCVGFKAMKNPTTGLIDVKEYYYVDVCRVLTSIDEIDFDMLDDNRQLNISEVFYYNSNNVGHLSEVISQSPDPENKYTVKRIKYVGDYTVSSFSDQMSLALNHLLNIGHFSLNTPVETIALQGSSLNDLKIIGGELNTFKMVGNRVVQDANYKLELIQPIIESEDCISESEFCWSSVVGSEFKMDDRYRKISSVTAFDDEYRPLTIKGENDISNTVIRDYAAGRVVAEITNAKADECAYTSFETTNGGGWTYSNSWTTSPSFYHLGFNLKKAKTGTRIFGFQGTNITKEAKPGKYIVSMWCTSPAFSLSVNGQNQPRIVEQDGEDVMGWAYYEYLVDCTQNYDITITGSIDEFIDELRMYPVDATMKTVAYNSDGTVRTECGINNRCTTYLYDSWKRLEWTLDDNWEILTYNDYHIKDQNDPNDHSWTKQKIVLVEGVNKTNVISATAHSELVTTSIVYSDGLGRPLQNIAVHQSPAGYDMVSFHEYDELGRESRKYAPFTRPANHGDFIADVKTRQENFYQSASKIKHTDYPFAESVFEPSPLNRVVESGSMGEEWQIGNNHTIQSFTLLNDETDQILQWKNYSGEGACAMDLVNGGAIYYPANTLIKQYVVNEHGDEMWEFTNALGQIICKRIKVWASQSGTDVYTWTNDDGTNSDPYYQGPISGPVPDWVFYDTYFIYDDFGRIVYEIPAIAIQKMDGTYCFANHPDELNYDKLDGYFTVYSYDKRGRQVLKKKPGEEMSQYVYNTLNQIVLSRSPELPTDQWNFIKYDVMGRPVQTGLFTTSLTREAMQLICDNATSNLWELKSGSTSSPYQGNSFPVQASGDIVLTETYYDDYNFDLNNYSYNFWDTNQDVDQLVQGRRTRGATTGMKVRILESTEPYPYLLTVNYFDKNGRANLSFKEHIFGGFDRFLTEYDYTGKVTQTLRTHKKTISPIDEPVFILNKFTYDHAGRPLETKQKTGNGELITLSKLKYNELGQVIKKHLHITPETTIGMQSIDYRYNERGWLTKINNADLVNDGDNLESWDVFGEELIYQEQDRYISNTFQAIPQYNGNVSAIKWKTKRDSDENSSHMPGHSYVYRYDQLGQMLGAFYAASNDTYIDDYSDFTNNWDECLSYDANGNIRTLRRHRGIDDLDANLNDPIIIDDLTYDYKKWTNKLINIYDMGEVNWQTGFTHFVDVSSGQDDYHYDEEARLKGDLNKNIEFQYNHLDLVEWAGNNDYGVDFVWDATGSKLRSISPQSVSTYIGGIEYKDDQITHIATAEGIMRKNQQDSWTYDYYLKDHLGNIRAIVATEHGSPITETATMELTVRLLEEAGFENISTTEYDKPYLYPYDPNDPTNAKVSKLNAQQGKIIGPSKVLAVKRAELLDVSTQYWYNEEPGETVIDDLSEIMAGVLLNLTGAGIGVIPSGPEHGLALINNVSGSQYQALETFITNSFDGIDLETSGAHLVYMFFDNRMVLDPTISGRIAVGDANTLGQITQQSLRMPTDGFFYVYTTTLSARSYYFDKLTIKRWKPQVRVKYDYYPYGMTWKNPDLQDEENRLHDHTYQDKEFLFGEYDGTVGLALYDFHARMYDPAIGRWLVPDPAAQYANPYLAMGNNPVSMIDPTGTMAWDDIAETDNDEWYKNSEAEEDEDYVWYDSDEEAEEALGKGKAVKLGLFGWQVKSDGTTTYYDQFGGKSNSVPISEITIGEDTRPHWMREQKHEPPIDIDKYMEGWLNVSEQMGDLHRYTENTIQVTAMVLPTIMTCGGTGVVLAGARGMALNYADDGIMAAAKTGASLSTNGAKLSRHLGQLEKYGKGGFKELQNGRFRYYGNVQSAAKSGKMQGARLVREWNPATGYTRTWYETLDHASKIRQVHPKYNDLPHYIFDASGKYLRKW